MSGYHLCVVEFFYWALWRPANIREIKHTCFLSSWKWVEIGTTKYWATTHVSSVYQQLLGDCMPFLTYVFPKGTSTTAFASLKWDNFGLYLIDIFAHEIWHLASSAHMRELNRKVCWVSCRIIISFWKFHFDK